MPGTACSRAPRSLRRAALIAGVAALLAGLFAAPGARAEGPRPGEAAPGFRLQDQSGRWVTLDQHRGRWVILYFYQKDNAPACTAEAIEFRDAAEALRAAGATILGVSVDDVESHADFASQHGLPFAILADPDKSTARAYGVFYKALGLMELARRETFVIDPQGRIARRYTEVEPKGHAARVLADLQALRSPR